MRVSVERPVGNFNVLLPENSLGEKCCAGEALAKFAVADQHPLRGAGRWATAATIEIANRRIVALFACE